MGIYGTIVEAFPEQLRPFTYFNQLPTVNGGYNGISSVSGIMAILQLYATPGLAHSSIEGISVKENDGNIITQTGPFLWYPYQLNVGWFITASSNNWYTVPPGEEDWIFRILSNNKFDFESNICIHGLEKLVGLNGTTTSGLTFNVGLGYF